MFGSREAGLGRVSRVWSMSFGERRIKKGFLSMIWSWIFIDTSVKERGNFLIVGFPRVARPDVYFEEYWSMGLPWKKDEEGLLTHSLKLNFPRMYVVRITQCGAYSIFQKLLHDAEMRLIMWPRGKRDCPMARRWIKNLSLNFVSLPLAARGCLKNCRRLRLAQVMPPRVGTCACSFSYEQIWFS